MAEIPPTFDEITRMRIVLSRPGMERIRVEHDLIYRSTSERDLTMDVYWPLEPVGRPPFVLLVHGGPIPEKYSPKDWGNFVSMGELLAASGFATFTFNHRFYDAPHLEAAQTDVEAALQKVRSGLWDLDPERGAVFCYSGSGVFLSQLLEKPPAFVRGLVGYYPCLDIREVPPGQRDLLGPDIRKRFSSVLSVHGGSPPMLLARAGLDQPALNRTIDLFVDAALGANAPLDLLNHPAGRHGFDVLDAVPRSREILESTRVFLTACLL